MSDIRIGSNVMMATVENIVFEVINKNVDGSFEIEAKLDGTNIIKYGNIAQEMLRLVAQESKWIFTSK